MTAEDDQNVTILSRFFDENVLLVAGICSRCYLDGDDDVKIVGVNRKFLRKTAPPPSFCLRKPSPSDLSSKNFTVEYHKRTPLWSPPRSPHNLIEESLYRDPWSLLVATIFLNKTACMCARPRIEEFLSDFAGPLEVLKKHPGELEKYFLDLGLFKKRAEQVWRMSHDYVHKSWKSPSELYGIGKYGNDAYRMFILGDLDVEPDDRFLRIYRDWARMTRTSC